MTTTITNVTELQAMSDDASEDYVLGNNIDASATSGWNGGAGFLPIGTSGAKFTGTFDGAGYTISGLVANRPASYYQSLFGWAIGATFQNVTLSDFSITGIGYAGSLVGFADGCTIREITVTGATVTATTDWSGGLAGSTEDCDVDDCFASVTLAGQQCSGGLIGYMLADEGTSTIDDCYSTGTITTVGVGEFYIGGLIGSVGTSTITGCYSTCSITTADADYVGGLIGNVGGISTISQCYATGNVNAGTGAVAGGLIGRCGPGSTNRTITISQCYSTGDVVSGTTVGGFVGYLSDAGSGNVITVSNCYARGDATASSTSGGLVALATLGTGTSLSITNCYSTGTPSDTTGGLICSNTGGTITSSYWDTETSGASTSDGGTGKTTAEMNLYVTFFNATWDIGQSSTDRNNSYPFLSWEIGETATTWQTYGSGVRTFIVPDVLDHKGRYPKGARVRAYRADSHELVTEDKLDAHGSVTLTGLPNDVDVAIQVTWGGPRTQRHGTRHRGRQPVVHASRRPARTHR